ncbi:MAG: HEAT repeat domain-containing protein [Cyanosarcina radialis HA8281-LM2]|jgi:HEAT repeat protein|nr:HEAT repeat domain-containing protein [Cyanosarcina radialis HA8281-LM2]
MAIAVPSDPIIRLVFWVTIGVLLLDVCLLLLLLVMRYLLLSSTKRQQQFLEVWRPILMQSLVAPPESIPRLQKSERVQLLSLWNQIHASVRGKLQDNLNQIGLEMGIDLMAMQLLHKGDLTHQLIAIATLGHLRQKSAWPALQKLVLMRHPTISAAAARALVQIDDTAAISWLATPICDRIDWSLIQVVQILREVNLTTDIQPLLNEVLYASPSQSLRLFRVLELTHAARLVSIVPQLLESPNANLESIAACLRILGQFPSHQNLKLARQYVTHPSWIVRVQAANALGKIGVKEDEAQLIVMLSDRRWWVRYRAAQALAKLPFVSVARLREIRASQSDRYARDILTQVIAEKEVSDVGV